MQRMAQVNQGNGKLVKRPCDHIEVDDSGNLLLLNNIGTDDEPVLEVVVAFKANRWEAVEFLPPTREQSKA